MPIEKYDKKICSYVTADVHAALTKLADRRGVTVSQLVSELVTRELAREARRGVA
jgi:predicted HicB family RNase H-like nuclease